MSACEQYSGASIAVICEEDVQIFGQYVDVSDQSNQRLRNNFPLQA
jgi:hypothetical protein